MQFSINQYSRSFILVTLLLFQLLNSWFCLTTSKRQFSIQNTAIAQPDFLNLIERYRLTQQQTLTRNVRTPEDDESKQDKPVVDEQSNDSEAKVDDDLKSDEDDNDDDESDDNSEEDDKSDPNDSNDSKDDDFKSQADHKLLVLILDGFSHGYIPRDKTLKGFPRMAKQGVHAKLVNPVHPSNSYPNYYSILTGLYAESHGFVDNYIRDRSTGELFLGSPHPNGSNMNWWIQTEALWTTAEKYRVKTAVLGWADCQANLHNNSTTKRRPPVTICEPHEGYVGKKEKDILQLRLERIIDDFKQHKYRLALLYYGNIDHIGHKYGPQSRITKQAVRDVDEILYDLQDMLVKNDLDDEVNVYVLSNHGMISVKKFKHIKLDELIDMNDIELVLGIGSSVQLLAERGKHLQVLTNLRQANVKGLNVYEKSTIPERFHLRRHRNLLPIYLTVDKGYLLVPPAIQSKVYPDLDTDNDGEVELKFLGEHGYDPEFVDEMKGIMYAFGPDIRDGIVLEEINQVDHYNVFCHLLGIEPKFNNGSEKVMHKILSKFQSEDSTENEEDNDDDSEEDNKDDDDDDDDDDNAMTLIINNPLTILLLTVAMLFLF